MEKEGSRESETERCRMNEVGRKKVERSKELERKEIEDVERGGGKS